MPIQVMAANGDMASMHGRAPFKLSYIDFPPRCAGAGNVICAPDYERFEYVPHRPRLQLRNSLIYNWLLFFSECKNREPSQRTEYNGEEIYHVTACICTY